jgi:hypothetical protein
MNKNLSLGLKIESLDSAAQCSAYKAIGNKALGLAIFAAMRVVRARTADESLDAPAMSRQDEADAARIKNTAGEHDLDERNELNENQQRDPRVGLENRPTPEDELNRYASIYAFAADHCQQLQTSQFDLPQDVAGRVTWQLTRAKDALSSRPQNLATASVAEKIAFSAKVGTAKTEFEFWQKNHGEVIALVETAVADVALGDSVDDPIDYMTGVDAHQFAIAVGTGLNTEKARIQVSLARFKPGTTLYRSLASDLAGIELTIPIVEAFADDLEEAYAGEITAAIKAGRNLLSTEVFKTAYDDAVNRLVNKALDTQTKIKADIDE